MGTENIYVKLVDSQGRPCEVSADIDTVTGEFESNLNIEMTFGWGQIETLKGTMLSKSVKDLESIYGEELEDMLTKKMESLESQYGSFDNMRKQLTKLRSVGF